MSKRNVVSWSAMIFGYALNGDGDEAFRLFNQMQVVDAKPNSVTCGERSTGMCPSGSSASR